MALEREPLDSEGEARRRKEGQMRAAIIAQADHAQHRGGSGALGRAREVLLAIDVPLHWPISTRSRSRPNRRRAAMAVSGAERFEPASDTSTILICYDGSPGARRAIEHTGRLLPGIRAVVLDVWSAPAGLAACGLAGTAPHDFADWARTASDEAAEGVQLAKAAGLDAVALTAWSRGFGDRFSPWPASAARTSSSSALAALRVCEPSLTAPFRSASSRMLDDPCSSCRTSLLRPQPVSGARSHRAPAASERLQVFKREGYECHTQMPALRFDRAACPRAAGT